MNQMWTLPNTLIRQCVPGVRTFRRTLTVTNRTPWYSGWVNGAPATKKPAASKTSSKENAFSLMPTNQRFDSYYEKIIKNSLIQELHDKNILKFVLQVSYYQEKFKT